MPKVIKDTIGLCEAITPQEEAACKKHGIPTFTGKLFAVEDMNYDSNGNPIFRKIKEVNSNTVVLGGAVLALKKLFGTTPTYMPPTLNEIEKINDGVKVNDEATYIKCFGVGIGGSSLTLGNVYDPNFLFKEMPEMVPFRISDTPELLDAGDLKDKYYFRKQISPDPSPQWGWFLKEFENTPVPRSFWKDSPDPNTLGTEILSDVSNVESSNLVETLGECVIKIEKEDIRPWFQYSGQLKQARYNSFALFTGVKRQIADTPGYIDYVGVRLFSIVNFNNVALDLPTEATYLYRVYAAI